MNVAAWRMLCQQSRLESGVPHDQTIFPRRFILNQALPELRRRSHRPARIHPPCLRHGGGRIVDSSLDARRSCSSRCRPSGGSRNDGADASTSPSGPTSSSASSVPKWLAATYVNGKQMYCRSVHAGTGSTSVSDGARARRRRTGTRLDVHARRTPGLGFDPARGRLQGVCRRSSRPRPIAVSPRRQWTVPAAEPDVGKPVGAIHTA